MFNSIIGGGLTPINFTICVLTAIILGFLVAFVHSKTEKSNKTYVESLVILPVLVTVVILLVNGNLGTSVAIAGAFSLIRFRSIPGNSKEIVNVFFAMVIGVAVGTGYLAFAAIFTIITCLLSFLLYKTKFGEERVKDRILKISIPEDLDYEEVFDDVFDKYLEKCNLRQAKTINMGSMFELTYLVTLRNNIKEKDLIDDIRVKNGNLKITLTHEFENRDVL